jgi:hypothetical protein
MPLRVVWNIHDWLGEPFRLSDLMLDTVDDYGVYLIYQPPTMITGLRVISIGQGLVADRLAQHKLDPALSECANAGLPLLVTWTSVAPSLMDRVERYLTDLYRPVLGRALPPEVPPLAVNLPFAAPPPSSSGQSNANQSARHASRGAVRRERPARS